LVSLGVTHGTLGHSEEQIAAYETVISRFGDAEEPELREHVGKSLINRGFALGKLGRREEEIAAYETVIARFGDAEEPELREVVIKAVRAHEKRRQEANNA
jgi:tetratricopeptide (TPR) repeat protein